MSATYENQVLHCPCCIKRKRFLYWMLATLHHCKVQTVRVAEQKSDSALMVIQKVIRYVTFRKKPTVDSEPSTLRYKIGSSVTFHKHCILPDLKVQFKNLNNISSLNLRPQLHDTGLLFISDYLW